MSHPCCCITDCLIYDIDFTDGAHSSISSGTPFPSGADGSWFTKISGSPIYGSGEIILRPGDWISLRGTDANSAAPSGGGYSNVLMNINLGKSGILNINGSGSYPYTSIVSYTPADSSIRKATHYDTNWWYMAGMKNHGNQSATIAFGGDRSETLFRELGPYGGMLITEFPLTATGYHLIEGLPGEGESYPNSGILDDTYNDIEFFMHSNTGTGIMDTSIYINSGHFGRTVNIPFDIYNTGTDPIKIRRLKKEYSTSVSSSCPDRAVYNCTDINIQFVWSKNYRDAYAYGIWDSGNAQIISGYVLDPAYQGSSNYLNNFPYSFYIHTTVGNNVLISRTNVGSLYTSGNTLYASGYYTNLGSGTYSPDIVATGYTGSSGYMRRYSNGNYYPGSYNGVGCDSCYDAAHHINSGDTFLPWLYLTYTGISGGMPDVTFKHIKYVDDGYDKRKFDAQHSTCPSNLCTDSTCINETCWPGAFKLPIFSTPSQITIDVGSVKTYFSSLNQYYTLTRVADSVFQEDNDIDGCCSHVYRIDIDRVMQDGISFPIGTENCGGSTGYYYSWPYSIERIELKLKWGDTNFPAGSPTRTCCTGAIFGNDCDTQLGGGFFGSLNICNTTPWSLGHRAVFATAHLYFKTSASSGEYGSYANNPNNEQCDISQIKGESGLVGCSFATRPDYTNLDDIKGIIDKKAAGIIYLRNNYPYISGTNNYKNIDCSITTWS